MTDYREYFGEGGLNDRLDSDSYAAGIGLSEEEIAWRKAFVGFDGSHAERLEGFEDDFRDVADELADRFYEHLADTGETAAVIDRSSKDVEELKRTQKAYLTTLADGEYDREYFRNRARIGKLHEMLDMPIKHYIGQYSVYHQLFLEILSDRTHERLTAVVETALEEVDDIDSTGSATGPKVVVDREELLQRLQTEVDAGYQELESLLTIVNLDMQVVVETYLESLLTDLEIERDRFLALVENIPTPVVIIRHASDADQQIEHVNPAFEQLFGYTVEDLSDKPLEQYLRSRDEYQFLEDEEAEPWAVQDETGDRTALSEDEVTLETKFGQRTFLRVSALVDRPGQDPVEYAYYLDVTDQKNREERLQVLSRILRHNIRNEINVISGALSMLREDELAPENLIDPADRSAATLLEMSEKIREVEELVAGAAELHPVDIAELCADLLTTLEAEYPECEFTVTVPLSETPLVNGTDSLRVALENVLENGAKHSNAEPPSVEVTIVESLDGEHLDVKIADNGPGIPPEEYEVFTGDRGSSQVTHASGLGLWTVHWIVTKIGGTVRFDSNAPRGSVVTLRLPKA
ncbi:protoglobin domain-containing protein [Natrarchaeobaculum aegyptiacum]|uniref:histidine kinase n=1 Tax=Natrarchaeobaculum aegyptiacum TaxID=745377 RepID=A0A2Z2HVH2_9EURY|nr:protoglobin domain-containing protein [Natrarchaeobaculum aegyptiacum]ARS91212.1 hypothetical protein B1756_16745 [Natrarchaeobaculum aegyptiacum]